MPLARLVSDKTGGNAFFAIQFLTTLYQEGLLTYNERKMHWSWDLRAIRGQGFTGHADSLSGQRTEVKGQERTLVNSTSCGRVSRLLE